MERVREVVPVNGQRDKAYPLLNKSKVLHKKKQIMIIADQINEIVARRKGLGRYLGMGHLDYVLNKLSSLKMCMQSLQEFRDFRERVLMQIENQSGEYFNLYQEDNGFKERVISTDPTVALDKLQYAISECEKLKSRFSRDAITISVIGRARQGKSTLLQAISGLTDDVIPAASGADCTGAKSIICNENGETHATIVFYTEQELIEQVQKYLDALNYPMTLLHASDIKRIRLQDIERELQSTAKAQSQFDHLKKYVDHFEEYRKYLGENIEINNVSDVRSYVAQYDADNYPTYQYLGVKEVLVYARFNYQQAGSIRLIDTIGVGDIAFGIKDKMIETLIHDSDAAILLRRPDRYGDGVREVDNDLIDLISSKTQRFSLDKSFFYCLNVSDQLGNRNIGSILQQQLRQQLNLIFDKPFILQIDCANREEVERELLIPMLESLTQNLVEIDNSILANVNLIFESTFLEYQQVNKAIQNVIKSGAKKESNINSIFENEFERCSVFRDLEVINNRYKQHKFDKSVEIKTEVVEIFKVISSFVPTVEEITRRLTMGNADAYFDNVYYYFSDYLRTSIANQFEKINRVIYELQEHVKNEVIDILYREDSGMLSLVPLNRFSMEGHTRREWLEYFINDQLDDYPIVKDAFQYIASYRLNIEGLLEYIINNSLECLDPESNQFVHLAKGDTPEESAHLIQQGLLTKITRIAKDIDENIEYLLDIPANSFYTLIRKFREKIVYNKDGNKELYRLYRDHALSIWRDKFAIALSAEIAIGSWNDFKDRIATNSKKQNFVIEF